MIISRTKDYVVNAFKAADLDGNRMCDLSEFILLYRHIEKEKFDEDSVIKIFEEASDLIEGDEKKLSFDKFTSICVEFNLFSDSQQNDFLLITNNNQLSKFYNELKIKWETKKNALQTKLEFLKSNLDDSEYQNWENILTVLEERIKKETIEEDIEHKSILIAYKLMDEELERIIEKKHEHEQNEAEIDEFEEDIIEELN